MKKSLIIILSIFYLAVASGLSFNYHFCGGKLKSVSIFLKSDEKGCCGSKKKSKGCCSDKLAFFKIKSEQSSEGFAKINPTQCNLGFIYPTIITLQNNNRNFITHVPEIYPPPEKVKQKLFLKLCTILI